MEYIAAEMYLAHRWENEDAGQAPPPRKRPRKPRISALPLRVRHVRYGIVFRGGSAGTVGWRLSRRHGM
jgi:hypothetical protein